VAILLALLSAEALTAAVSVAAASPEAATHPTVDVPAPRSFDAPLLGGIAARVELVGSDSIADHRSSTWYRLAYVTGGSRLQVFEHYPATVRSADTRMIESQQDAWQMANRIVGTGSTTALPAWAQVRTGTDIGYSAGLMITLAYIDALTPGAFVGDLRVAGTGGIGSDGVVMPVDGLDAKVAAARLTRPDVIFTTGAPRSIGTVTVVESEHTRLLPADRTTAQWLNLAGYERAGRVAASHPGELAIVAVHDVRQALSYLCGRTGRAATCAAAASAANLPIGLT